MSRQITSTFARSLSIASATLLIHLGTAAAATPHSDFQQQVSAVLAGKIASHSSLHANSTREELTGSQDDAQEFARQLLRGWSVSHPGRTLSAAQSRNQTAPDVTRRGPAARTDIQSTVQRLLLGLTAARNAS
ncbi:MAG TPA: hypothetical protein VGT07_08445 [Steroidobacteraceae bacterium]|nr:hypothetical protein [Steroidobacteraceae bacterium]